ncbi:FG-GAP-like repeat-containing protein [Candidatus Latescibacterota bacterium]
MKVSAFNMCVFIALSSICTIFTDIVSAQTIPSFSRTDYIINGNAISDLVDFNNDGKLDIAFVAQDSLTIMFGKADGTFEIVKKNNIQSAFPHFITNDFNNDGINDMFMNPFLSLGDSFGGFEEAKNLGISGIGTNTGDFNNDNIPDIILLNSNNKEVLEVSLGNGDGSFQVPIPDALVNRYGISPKATGDFNDDGNLDVVVRFDCYTDEFGSTCKCLRTESAYFFDNIAVLFGNGDGTFQDSTLVIREEYSGNPISPFFSFTDINNDNNHDIFYYGSSRLKMYLSDSNGSFSFQWECPLKSEYYSFLIDADSDGLKDILSVGYVVNYTNNFYLRKGNGDGTFGEEIRGTINGINPRKFMAADLNGDNKEDFISVGSDTLAVFHNEGVTSKVSEREELTQSSFTISQNYPNPFNSSTTLSYSIPQSSHVILEVFSITGQKVATLVDSYMNAGEHSAVFDSNGLASGIYFYRLESEGIHKTGSMTLVK